MAVLRTQAAINECGYGESRCPLNTDTSPRILLLFVDGLGLGPPDPSVNPVHSGVCPRLAGLLTKHSVPLDAGMGVPGTPQSATGQTALLTGVNAAQAVGCHVEGFPGPALKQIVTEHNIFRRIVRLRLACTFANGYYLDNVEELKRRRIQSVTTVATLSALGTVRTRADLERDRAVYQDLTRAGLHEQGYAGPLITPTAAAGHLLAIAAEHHLTLFEYFQTDRAAHSGDIERIRQVLGEFDEFLGALLHSPDADRMLLVLTSDHGNIEDITVRGHTLNPVPFAAAGRDAAALMSRVRSLPDVTPALLSVWERGGDRRSG